MHVKKKLVLCVGNGMMGDDGAGSLLVQKMQRLPLDNWEVLHGGSAPENVLFRAREMAPDYVLVVDAADMDLAPGTVRMIPDEKLNDPFLLTTHALPLTFLIEALREFVPKVELLGIQPEVVAFGYPISESVKQAVNYVYDGISNSEMSWTLY